MPNYTVTIDVKFNSAGGRVFRAGTFPLNRLKPEEVALQWIKRIQKEVYFEELLEVIVDGKENITEEIIRMIKAPLPE